MWNAYIPRDHYCGKTHGVCGNQACVRNLIGIRRIAYWRWWHDCPCVIPLSSVSLMIYFSFVCPWAVFWMPCFDLNHKWAVTTTLRCKENSQLMFSWQPCERCVLYFVVLYGQLKIFHGFVNNAWCIINMSNFLGIFVNDEWILNNRFNLHLKLLGHHPYADFLQWVLLSEGKWGSF